MGNTLDGQMTARQALDAAAAAKEARLAEVRTWSNARLAELEAADKVKAERQAAAHAERIESQLRDGALANWKRNGGTVEDFNAQWPALRLDILKARTVAADGAKRRTAGAILRVIASGASPICDWHLRK